MPNLIEYCLDQQNSPKAWCEYINKIHELTANGNVLICRGQADIKWGLSPSISRIPIEFNKKTASTSTSISDAVERFEHEQLQLFKDRVCVYADSRLPMPDSYLKDPLKTWMVMQHFGFPTRLLDWTTNPYAAAYFAARDNPFGDGSIYIMKMAISFRLKPATYDAIRESPLFVVPCLYPTARSERQDSVFTVSNDVLAAHCGKIGELKEFMNGNSCVIEEFHKVIVPERTKEGFMKHLCEMGISGKSLYSDLEGLAKYCNELLTKTMRMTFLDDHVSEMGRT